MQMIATVIIMVYQIMSHYIELGIGYDSEIDYRYH